MTHHTLSLGDFFCDMRRVPVDILVMEGRFYSHQPYMNKLAQNAKHVKARIRISVTGEQNFSISSEGPVTRTDSREPIVYVLF